MTNDAGGRYALINARGEKSGERRAKPTEVNLSSSSSSTLSLLGISTPYFLLPEMQNERKGEKNHITVIHDTFPDKKCVFSLSMCVKDVQVVMVLTGRRDLNVKPNFLDARKTKNPYKHECTQ